MPEIASPERGGGLAEGEVGGVTCDQVTARQIRICSHKETAILCQYNRTALPFTIQANYAGKYWRGAAPPMFNRSRRREASPLGRRVRRERGHFYVGKPVDQRKNAFLADLPPGIPKGFRQICQRGFERPENNPVDCFQRERAGRPLEVLAGEAGPPPITIRP